MTSEEAIEIGHALARERGWPWREPVAVVRRRRWFVFGRRQWQLRSNAEMRGGNVFVIVDDETRHVIRAGYGPR